MAAIVEFESQPERVQDVLGQEAIAMGGSSISGSATDDC